MRKIVAIQENPSIPVRDMDWCAFYEGEEEAGMYGWGPTEAAAIQDFIENCQPAHDLRLDGVDWDATPPFIKTISGGGTYEVNVKVHSMVELHAAHDLVLKAFSDARSSLLEKRWRDVHQA